MTLMSDNRAVAGANLGHLWGAAGILQPQMQALLAFARAGRIKPRVDRAFRVEDAAAAHRYVHERRNIGKVVLTF
jgi:NADPH:quinone reductase-like Zn-dependent oxidoreductase